MSDASSPKVRRPGGRARQRHARSVVHLLARFLFRPHPVALCIGPGPLRRRSRGDGALPPAQEATPEEAEDGSCGGGSGSDSDGGVLVIDIPEDAYGAAILCLVRDSPVLLGRAQAAPATAAVGDVCDPSAVARRWQTAAWSCIAALGVLMMSVFLQGFLLTYIYIYVISDDQFHVQRIYHHFRQNMYTPAGEFLAHLWPTYENRQDLCEITQWNRPFYYSVLVCWNLVMLVEVRKSEELIANILRVPTCRDVASMLDTRGAYTHIVALTRSVRASLLAFAALPRMAICLTLLWMGCEWLSTTGQFEDLVMNTVAMNFIVDIDNMLFIGLLPQSQQQDVKLINFRWQQTPQELAVRNDPRMRARGAYRKSLLYLVVGSLFVIFYAEWVQDVMPPGITDIRAVCHQLITHDLQPKCTGTTWYMRGMPAAGGCFPLPERPQGSGAIAVRPV